MRTASGTTVNGRQYVWTLPSGRSHRIIAATGDFGVLDNTPE
jgi:hypothetical protein